MVFRLKCVITGSNIDTDTIHWYHEGVQVNHTNETAIAGPKLVKGKYINGQTEGYKTEVEIHTMERQLTCQLLEENLYQCGATGKASYVENNITSEPVMIQG